MEVIIKHVEFFVNLVIVILFLAVLLLFFTFPILVSYLDNNPYWLFLYTIHFIFLRGD